jgi:hypothetical protein
MKFVVFRNVTSCSLVERCKRFGETFYLHLQGRQLSDSEKDQRQKMIGCEDGVRSEPL